MALRLLPPAVQGFVSSKDRIAGLVRAVLPPNFNDMKWRRVTWPGCPACLRAAAPCCCAREKFWLPPLPDMIVAALPPQLRCNGEIRLDIETGVTICVDCGAALPFSESVFVCAPGCGAIFNGGELWQGMSNDLAAARQWPWMRSVKSRVAQEITGCGFGGESRLVATSHRRRCACKAVLYRLDGNTDICGNCLQRSDCNE